MAVLDWCIVAGYVVIAITVGFLFSRRAGKSISEYFLSGRNLPWWVVGSSMVATTFAADTPLAVTEYVRQDGIWRNWIWWSLAISHVLAAVVFSRLWRRAMVLTDNELIEIRYHGKPAAALRAFKACYFSTLYNFIVMGWVTAAMSTVLSSFMKIPIVWAVVACMAIALFYSVLSGFWGVVVTDMVQFGVAIVGSIVFAVLAANEAGGMSAVLSSEACTSGQTLSLFPSLGAGTDVWMNFLVFVLVMWWAYQGSDGGGYIIQRMMSAKNERHALIGTFWFALAHYILRVWPWVVVALVSMVMLPELTSHKEAYPELLSRILPAGLKGLCVAMFLAAYMSTIDTHLNWGSSYIVNDLYKRFFKQEANPKHYVVVSRITSVVLMLVSGFVALQITRITAAWELLWAMGAGIGAVLILRWFWWRINAWSEISALSASLIIATALQVYEYVSEVDMQFYVKLLTVVFGSAAVWLAVTFLTRPEPEDVLKKFTDRVRPGGWWPFEVDKGIASYRTLVAWLGGVLVVFGGMFLIGGMVLGRWIEVLVSAAVSAAGVICVYAGLRGTLDTPEA
ncbi:sodium:solute symporter family protein [Myxococcota bacterium]